MSLETERVDTHVKRVRELVAVLNASKPSDGLDWYGNVGALIVMADALAWSASQLSDELNRKERNA